MSRFGHATVFVDHRLLQNVLVMWNEVGYNKTFLLKVSLFFVLNFYSTIYPCVHNAIILTSANNTVNASKNVGLLARVNIS